MASASEKELILKIKVIQNAKKSIDSVKNQIGSLKTSMNALNKVRLAKVRGEMDQTIKKIKQLEKSAKSIGTVISKIGTGKGGSGKSAMLSGFATALGQIQRNVGNLPSQLLEIAAALSMIKIRGLAAWLTATAKAMIELAAAAELAVPTVNGLIGTFHKARDAVIGLNTAIAGQAASLAGVGAAYKNMAVGAKGVLDAQVQTARQAEITSKSLSRYAQAQRQIIGQNGAMVAGNMAVAGSHQKQGDAAKMAGRITVAGFKAMLISQAAWLAGFALVLGPITKFVQIMADAISIQNEFARVARVMRSETQSMGDALTTAYTAMNTEMVRTGKSAKDVGEVLYQLGSAGLTAEESVSALASSMQTIIGAEADVTNITKTIAGIYNNMKEQIYETAEGFVVFRTSMNATEGPLTKVTDLTKKFVAINDILVRAFDAHQVEMSELNDGLKYSIATSNAAGISFTQLTGVLVTLNDHMIKAGVAGRSFQAMLSRIVKSPDKFAEAFDIEIDPSKTLDIQSIFKQLNAEFEKGNLSVERLGTTFTRLGLRGAKTFIVLATHWKEVEQNIRDLEHNSKGAADAMAKVMLERPVAALQRMYQAMVQIGKYTFGPLVESVLKLVNVFNSAFMAITNLITGMPVLIQLWLKLTGVIVGCTLVMKAFMALNAQFPVISGTVAHLRLQFILLRETMALMSGKEFLTKIFTAPLKPIKSLLSGIRFLWTGVALFATSLTTATLVVSGFLAGIGLIAFGLFKAVKGTHEADKKMMAFARTMLNTKEITKEFMDTIVKKGAIDSFTRQMDVMVEKYKYFATVANNTKVGSEQWQEARREMDYLAKSFEYTAEGAQKVVTAYETAGGSIDEYQKHLNETNMEMKNAVFFATKAAEAHTASAKKTSASWAATGGIIGEFWDRLNEAGKNYITKEEIRWERWKSNIMLVWLQVGQGARFLKDKLDKWLGGFKFVAELQVKMDDKAKEKVEADLVALQSNIQVALDNHPLLFGVSVEKDDLKGVKDLETFAIGNKIKDSMLVRKAMMGDELAMTDKYIAQQRLRLSQIEEEISAKGFLAKFYSEEEGVAKEANEKLKEYSATQKEIVSSLGLRANKGAVIEKQMMSLDSFRMEKNLGADIFNSFASGANNASVIWEKFTNEMEAATTKSTQRQMDDLVKLWAELSPENYAEFSAMWDEVGSKASGNIQGMIEKAMGFKDAITESKDAVSALGDALQELNIRAGADFGKIDNMFGVGSAAAIKFGSSIEGDEKKLKELTRTIRKARDDYNAMSTSNAVEMKAAYDKKDEIILLEEKHLELTAKIALAQTKSAAYSARAYDDIAREKSALEDAKNYAENKADAFARAASEAAVGSREALKALTSEQAQREKIRSLTEQIFGTEKQLIDLKQGLGKKTEKENLEYHKRSIELADKMKNVMGALNDDLVEGNEKIQSAQGDIGAKSQKNLDDLLAALQPMTVSFNKIAASVEKFDLAKMAEGMAPAFSTAKDSIDKVNEALEESKKRLKEMTDKTYIINIEQKVKNTGDKAVFARGGLVGNVSEAYVTRGEGYIPPHLAKSNMGRLGAINAGAAMPLGFNVPTFMGKSGTDAIKTMLPQGSFIISKRGMQALDKASSSVPASRTNYAMGGLVDGSVIGDSGEETASFNLTLNVGGKEKTYPLTGKKQIIAELGEELERQNLTRL